MSKVVFCQNCLLIKLYLELQNQELKEEEADIIALSNMIKVSIEKKQKETFAALTYAARSGDIESTKELLRQGAQADDCDYDGRTALAMV